MSEQTSLDNPYAAPAARVADADAGAGLALAERGTRLGAVIVDGLVFVLAYLPLILLIPAFQQGTAMAWIGGALVAAAVIGLMAYNIVLLYRHGQTIGKKLLGIRILRQDGTPVGLARIIFMRWLPVTLLGVIPLVGPFISLLDALLIFGEPRRCLHDQFADTIVVKV